MGKDIVRLCTTTEAERGGAVDFDFDCHFKKTR